MLNNRSLERNLNLFLITELNYYVSQQSECYASSVFRYSIVFKGFKC
jgi:hypothetical protein